MKLSDGESREGGDGIRLILEDRHLRLQPKAGKFR